MIVLCGLADGNTTFKRAFFESDRGQEVIRLQPRNEKYRAKVVNRWGDHGAL